MSLRASTTRQRGAWGHWVARTCVRVGVQVGAHLVRRPLLLWSVAMVGLVWLALGAGAAQVRGADWLAPWQAGEAPLTGPAYVLWHLRLPRVAFAALMGAALGLTGALTQGLFRNPLADPGLLGVSSGAACAAALAIVFLAGTPADGPQAWRPFLLPAAAFAGAMLVCLVLDRLARWLMADAIAGLLLTGIALNALAGAVIGLCTYLASDEQLRTLTFWTLGSLAAASWPLVVVLGLLLCVGWLASRWLRQALNALALGEAAAAHVGIDVRRVRTQVIVLVALISGFAVAWCGMVGFVGLIAPHIARRVVGADQRRVLPASMAVGAVLLLAADTLARSVAVPAEVPVGLFTSLMGAPFFLMLLAVRRQRE